MDHSGSTTIEMVTWLPILLLIIAAVVQFGLYFNARNAVQAAAFEAARQASLSEDPEMTAKDVVANYADGVLPGWHEGDRLHVDASMRGTGRPNQAISILVTYSPFIFMPRIIRQDGQILHLTATGKAEFEMEESP